MSGISKKALLSTAVSTEGLSITGLIPAIMNRGGSIQDFHGGGVQKIMIAHTHHKLKIRSHLLLQPARGPAFWVFDALMCYLSLIFKHSDTKWDYKKQSMLRPPLNLPLMNNNNVHCFSPVLLSGAAGGTSLGDVDLF